MTNKKNMRIEGKGLHQSFQINGFDNKEEMERVWGRLEDNSFIPVIQQSHSGFHFFSIIAVKPA